jgi:hypothetical protein
VKAVTVIRAAAIPKRLLRIMFVLHLVLGLIADEMGLGPCAGAILSADWKDGVTQFFHNWPQMERSGKL